MTNTHNLLPVRVSSLSTTYVKCRISAKENGVDANPTSGTVEFAFIPDSASNPNPVSGDWKAGSWESALDGGVYSYWGRCLIGSGGVVTLTAGSYDVWVRVTKSPEVVIDNVGVLNIY